MRIFASMEDAMIEIKRDVYKGSQLKTSRVQNRVGLDADARERVGYSYGIIGDFPDNPEELVELGKELGLNWYDEHGDEIIRWLTNEGAYRSDPIFYLKSPPNEFNHPALRSVQEGSHWAYTYVERLYGMQDAIITALREDPDTRRAFWPIFLPQDAIRASSPTRIPCSIGYHFMIRKQPNGQPGLNMTYLQRSADFDIFFLSDVWLARQIQLNISAELSVQPGLLVHNVISLHSYAVTGEEIY